MLHITHIITDLAAGGAEMSLFKLLSQLDAATFESDVISLTGDGVIGDKIRALGVPVRHLGMRPGKPDPRALIRLAQQLRSNPPDLVQTWMYHADLLGGLAAFFAGRIPTLWNIRNGNLDMGELKRGTLWTIRTCAGLSGWLPRKIISCSDSASRVHVKMGYADGKMLVIPNGFDLGTFHPDQDARQAVRAEVGVAAEALLVGLVARFDPVKDHQGFVRAAAVLHAACPGVHFLLCGEGVDWDNSSLAGWIDAAKLRDCFHLLGYRADIARLTAALDVATSSSAFGEGFPNIIGEAMACGVVCVVTDLGDSAYVVGDTGVVVPERTPQALADGWKKILELDLPAREDLGMKARRRIEQNFSLPQVTRQYEEAFLNVLKEVG